MHILYFRTFKFLPFTFYIRSQPEIRSKNLHIIKKQTLAYIIVFEIEIKKI